MIRSASQAPEDGGQVDQRRRRRRRCWSRRPGPCPGRPRRPSSTGRSAGCPACRRRRTAPTSRPRTACASWRGCPRNVFSVAAGLRCCGRHGDQRLPPADQPRSRLRVTVRYTIRRSRLPCRARARRRVLAVGRLIVIEGLDGSGKRTLTEPCRRAGGPPDGPSPPWPSRGTASTCTPTWCATRCTAGSAICRTPCTGPAVLFALDRRAAAAEIRDAAGRARRGAARPVCRVERGLRVGPAGRPGRPTPASPEWVRALEIDRFGVPVPDRQILLATPSSWRPQRARDRAVGRHDRALDRFEADAALQQRTGDDVPAAGRRRLPVAVDGADAGRRRVGHACRTLVG